MTETEERFLKCYAAGFENGRRGRKPQEMRTEDSL